MRAGCIRLVAFLTLISGTAAAGPDKAAATQSNLPAVASRTYAQNYKDLALTSCIARAYADDPKAAADAGATAAGLDSTWTNYDPEKGAGEIAKLVDRYLARQYNSIQGPDIKLDLQKCLDMYHGKELEALAKRVVITPGRSYRQDNPR